VNAPIPESSPAALSPEPVRRCVLITHGEANRTAGALADVVEIAAEAGVELLLPPDEEAKHPEVTHACTPWDGDAGSVELCLVLGGDGTMLRALQRFLGRPVPTMGVNFGRVGFLTSLMADELAERVPRVFAGEFELLALPTIDVNQNGRGFTAVNDVLVTSSVQGRMSLLEWEVNGIPMGERGCDGIVVATPAGSTGYNLSAGGPVMGWGVDAMCVTFVAPHAVDARPLVLSHGHRIRIRSRSAGFASRLVVDGHVVGSLGEGEAVDLGMGSATALLATLPDRPFLARYRSTFWH
jgi:NAD+ kinase